MELARGLRSRVNWSSNASVQDIAEFILSERARATAAERERCAVIAEMHEHRGEIAAAIRSGDHNAS